MDNTAARIPEVKEIFEILFDKMSEGFALCEMVRNADGKATDFRYLEVNPAWEKQTGISREKVQGKTVKEVIPTIEDFWIQTYDKVVKTGQPVQVENEVKELNRWFEVHAFKVSESQFAALFFDITERKKTMMELQQKVDQLVATNKLMIDRELKMIQLKHEIETLKGTKPRAA